MARKFIVSVSAQANTAAADSIVVEAPDGTAGALAVFLDKLIIFQPGKQTTAGLRLLKLQRTTTAGTGGTVTPVSTDGVGTFAGICRALPSALGTAGAALLTIPVYVPSALAAFTPLVVDLKGLGAAIPFGTTNGISLHDPGASGATDFAAALIFAEVS